MIDFGGDETHVLLNPRLPGEDQESLRTLVRNAPALAAHVWLATSGTSGSLKMTALSKRALLASAAAVNRHLEITSDDVWACVLPTFHVGGLGIHARASLSESRVVTADWSPGAFAAMRDVTLSALVPAQVADLVAGELRPPPLLRAVVVGGGRLAEGLRAEAAALGWPLLASYGLTECSSQVATELPGSSVLVLLDHMDARIETDGRLALRSPALMTGYATRVPGGASRFSTGLTNGWLVTEDRAALHERILEVMGRTGDFVKVGGESVDLLRLDGILESVAGRDAAIVAVEDARLGHVVWLAVTSHADAGRIVSAFNERVAPYERIRAVREVEELPRTALGKLMRRRLADQLANGQ